VSGLAILCLGIWMKIDLHIYLELSTFYFGSTPLILIGIGCGILIIGSLGCVCTVKGKSYLLYLFAAFLILIFIAQLSVAIASFVYRGKFEEGFKVGLDEAMQKYASDEGKRKSIDGLQSSLKCCGNATYADWFAIDWSGSGPSESVPTSCCISEDQCKNTGLPSDPTDIYTDGCFALVTSFLKKNFGIIGGVAVGFS
ncbi:hypothetical protein CAPTEDRAFT_31498, partial [Capitella teleta]